MKIVGKDVCPDKATYVAARVYDCVNTLKNQHYGLKLPTDADEVAVSCLEVKNRSNTPSRGGKNVIRINLGYWQVGNRFHQEYAAFARDPIIGNIDCKDSWDHWLVSTAHEVAHHIQYRYGPNITRFVHNYRKPHGECFKTIYKYLRRDYANPIIESRR